MNTPQNSIEPSEGCLAASLVVLGNKWTGLILREVSSGPKRFTELERGLEGISPRTLAQRLDDLVSYDILTKKSYAEMPPRVEYTLTPKGKEIVPILKQMAEWGEKYQSTPGA